MSQINYESVDQFQMSNSMGVKFHQSDKFIEIHHRNGDLMFIESFDTSFDLGH